MLALRQVRHNQKQKPSPSLPWSAKRHWESGPQSDPQRQNSSPKRQVGRVRRLPTEVRGDNVLSWQLQRAVCLAARKQKIKMSVSEGGKERTRRDSDGTEVLTGTCTVESKQTHTQKKGVSVKSKFQKKGRKRTIPEYDESKEYESLPPVSQRVPSTWYRIDGGVRYWNGTALRSREYLTKKRTTWRRAVITDDYKRREQQTRIQRIFGLSVSEYESRCAKGCHICSKPTHPYTKDAHF